MDGLFGAFQLCSVVVGGNVISEELDQRGKRRVAATDTRFTGIITVA